MTPETLLAHLDSGQPWPASGSGHAAADLVEAYHTQLALRALRVQRGEQPRGFKIGFTNRNIWPIYGVYAPVWGTVWDSSVRYCDDGVVGELDLARCCQPRIEPEAVFGMAATPPEGADMQALFDCIDWVAPGFEIVQSHAPGWKFTAAESVADGGLHARLLIGSRVPVRDLAQDALRLEQRLAECEVNLHQGGRAIERGAGRNVLDGPLHALAYFVAELRSRQGAPDLRAGDVVTTGTWTNAYPVAAGETWCAEFSAPLPRLEVRFT